MDKRGYLQVSSHTFAIKKLEMYLPSFTTSDVLNTFRKKKIITSKIELLSIISSVNIIVSIQAITLHLEHLNIYSSV